MKTPQDLFHDYLDGELTPHDWHRLEAWLAEDDAHAAEFIQWMTDQSNTFDALKGQYLQQVLQHQPPYMESSLYIDGPQASDLRPVRSSKLRWFAAAAAVLFGVLAANWVRTQRNAAPDVTRPNALASEDFSESDFGQPGSQPPEPAVVATVTRLEGCIWSDASRALTYGQQLVGGDRIQLREGVARVTFESGAVATIEGPCDFLVDNAMHGTIHRGRVAVYAPRRAYGFRIRSPNYEVIDLGTEFGVAVDDDAKSSEVHVFSGEVLSRTLGAQGANPGKLFRLKANDGLKFTSSDKRPLHISSNTSLFNTKLAEPIKLERDQPAPEGGNLALWLAADLSAQTLNGRKVFAWSDIQHGDNLSAEDAFQPDAESQPVLASNGINGKPAVRFNGTSSYLVTTPLETTDDQTIFIVCQFSKSALRPGRKRGGQLLNYNGPPHRLVSSTYEPGVLQIGEPIVDGFAPTRLGGKLFAGRINNRDVSESEIFSSALGANRPVVLAYRYDLTHNLASLWINDEMIEERAALRPAGITSRKTIGRHGFMKFFFAGDIGEMLIYNEALPPESMGQVTRYLSEKYAIPLATPHPPATTAK